MSVFILIDVQYLQNVVFSFENSSNGQNHSSSDSNHRIEKFLPAKFPHPLMLFWKPRVLKSRTYMLNRVFWHDLQHTTTPSKKWYFVTMVLMSTVRQNYEKLCTWQKNMHNEIQWYPFQIGLSNFNTKYFAWYIF